MLEDEIEKKINKKVCLTQVKQIKKWGKKNNPC
jgi:hypothetical protein